jgi:hypothetical protein
MEGNRQGTMAQQDASLRLGRIFFDSVPDQMYTCTVAHIAEIHGQKAQELDSESFGKGRPEHT